MAIARDAQTGVNPANGTSFTQAHTCTGSDRLITVWVMIGNVTDIVTGITYNGVSMTRAKAHLRAVGGAGYHFCYILHAPATGANNVVVSASTTMTGIVCYIESYTGVNQSSTADSTNENNTAASSTFTMTTTVVASNCWLVGNTQDDAGNATAGSGTSKISTLNAGFGQQLWDSNGTVGTGSQSLNMNNGAGTSWDGIIISIAPAAAATGHTKLLLTLGVG